MNKRRADITQVCRRIAHLCRIRNLESTLSYAASTHLSQYDTMCPRSSYPFYILTYFMKWVTTSWTDGTYTLKILSELSIEKCTTLKGFRSLTESRTVFGTIFIFMSDHICLKTHFLLLRNDFTSR